MTKTEKTEAKAAAPKPKKKKDKAKAVAGEHPLALGAYCTVRERTTTEGRAKIIGHEDGDHMYLVRFDRDKSKPGIRKVLPEDAEQR